MEIQDEVIRFVATYAGVEVGKITLDTTINNDLGIDGDEGGDFLLRFSEKFDVDLEPINKTYFGGEGFGLSAFIWPISALLHVLGLKQKLFRETSPLPVRVLVSSAIEHRWIHSS